MVITVENQDHRTALLSGRRGSNSSQKALAFTTTSSLSRRPPSKARPVPIGCARPLRQFWFRSLIVTACSDANAMTEMLRSPDARDSMLCDGHSRLLICLARGVTNFLMCAARRSFLLKTCVLLCRFAEPATGKTRRNIRKSPVCTCIRWRRYVRDQVRSLGMLALGVQVIPSPTSTYCLGPKKQVPSAKA